MAVDYLSSNRRPKAKRSTLTLQKKNIVDSELTKLSKFLNLMLRHKPKIIGLSPTPDGWVLIDDLLCIFQ